jgi:hypothetical protein
MRRTLLVLPGRLAVCRLAADEPLPGWVAGAGFCSVTRTSDELSVICDERRVPAAVRCAKGWRALKLDGPFEFSEVGVLLPVAAALAEAGISILPVATFDTDYVLVADDRLGQARERLEAAGHRVLDAP